MDEHRTGPITAVGPIPERTLIEVEKRPSPPPLPRDSKDPFEITTAEAWIVRDILRPLTMDDPTRDQDTREVLALRALYAKLETRLNPQPIGFLVWEEPMCSALRRIPDPAPTTPEGWKEVLDLGVEECLDRNLFLRREDLSVGMEVLACSLFGWGRATITAVDPPAAEAGDHAYFLEYRRDRNGFCCVTGSGNLRGIRKLELGRGPEAPADR